jgi:O-antigen/teichoic acid export membrane protein
MSIDYDSGKTDRLVENAASSKPDGNTLRKDFLWTAVGNLIYKGCQWGILVVLAKLTSVSDVGKFALGLAVVGPVVMFSQLHLRGTQATDAKNLYEFADYFGLRLISVIFVLFTSIVIGLSIYGTSLLTLIIILVALAKIIESVSDILFGLFQKSMRMDKVGKSMILKGSFSLILFIIVVSSTRSVVWGILVLGLSLFAILLGYDLPQSRFFSKITPRFRYNNLWSLAKLAAPLGVVMGIISLQANIPRYFIIKYLGEDLLGYFAAVSYVVVAADMLVLSIGEPALPRLAWYYLYNRRAFKWLLAKMLGIAFIMVLGILGFGFIFGKWFLAIAYTVDYVKYFDVFIWLLVVSSIAFLNSMLGYSLTAARLFRTQMLQGIVIGLIMAVSCAFLVPRYGLRGAAWAMLIATALKFFSAGTITLLALKRKPVVMEIDEHPPLYNHSKGFRGWEMDKMI